MPLSRAVPTNSEARNKIKMYSFKRTMFYLIFLKDKYKVMYICDTTKDGNHYRIHDEPQTILPKKHPSNTKSKRTQF